MEKCRMNDHLKTLVEKYVNQGFKIFPCNSDKTPCTVHGFKNAHDNKEILYKQFYKSDMLIGLPTGNVNNCIVIDIDIKDGRSVDELKEELKQYGELPETLEVETMSGGRHLYYKCDSTQLSSHSKFFDTSLPVDIRGNNGYVIGANYKNYFPLDIDDEDFEDLKSLMAELPDWIENYKKSTSDYQDIPLENFLPESEIREIRSALSYISSDDRDMWVNVGMALKNTGAPQAKGLWTEWSMKSDKFDPIDQEKKWKTFKPNDITIASIFHIAKQNGWFSTYEESTDSTNQDNINESEILTVHDELEKIKNFKVQTYAVGEQYAILNGQNMQLIRDTFTTIGGEKASAKTSLATDLSFNILMHNQDFCFIFFSLDDPETISAKRIISQGLKKNILEESNFETSEINSILSRIVITESIPPCDKITDKRGTISINQQIIQIVERVKQKTKTTKVIILIDYIQLVRPSGDRANLNEIVKEYKIAQKKLSEAGGCIIMLISQLNRDRDSGNSRYRETSEIENISDVCIDIRCNFVETTNPQTGKKIYVPEKENPTRFISIEKNKIKPAGQEFRTSLNPDFSFTQFITTNPIKNSSISQKENNKNQRNNTTKKKQPWQGTK